MSALSVKKNKWIIGLTGGIASGKSSALMYFKSLGYHTFSSDDFVKSLWEDHQFVNKMSAQFHMNLHDSNQFQTFKQMIFEHEAKREQLNEIIHPLVYKAIEAFKKSHEGILILDIPLLFETHYENQVDAVILITVPYDIQLKRLNDRGFSMEDAKARILSQMNELEKKKKTKYHVLGTLSWSSFYEALDRVIKDITHT
jgi:dephospho-CoA kinase